MNFLNPLFLAGLAALAVPLLIHIINLRKPQSIPFSTLAFFEELKKSTIRRLRIKRYLLLFIRCAAIILLALALARPFIPSNLLGGASGQESRAIAILIDNSPSMGQIDKEGPFIEQARRTAREFLNQAREKDRYLIQKTNGSPLNGELTSAASAKSLLENIEVEQKGGFLGNRLESIREQLAQSSQRQAVIYVFSDMQRTQWERLRDTNFSNIHTEGRYVGLQLIKVGNRLQNNVSIKEVSLGSQMLSKDKPLTIRVKIKNYANDPIANQFISLRMNGESVGQFQADLKEKDTKEFLFEYVPEKSGQIEGRVILEGDPVAFDNTHHFMLQIPQTRSALLVQQSEETGEYGSYLPKTLQAAERTSSQLTYENIQLRDLSADDWQEKDVIIFDGVRKIPGFLFSELQDYVQQGHGIVFFPSEKGDIRNYNDFFDLFNAGQFGGLRGEYGKFESVARLDRITEGHPIINQLFNKQKREEIRVNRPDVFFNYRYESRDGGGALNVLQTTINDPLLVEQSFGEGRFMLSSIGADPGWSNFPVNPLFAPIFYRTILYAASSEKGGISSYTLGQPFTWTGSLPEPVVTLSKEDETIKPEVKRVAEGYQIRYTGSDWTPGWLRLESGTFNREFALNLEGGESEFKTASHTKIDSLLGERVRVAGFREITTPGKAKKIIQSAGAGKEVWQWFIWAALFLLLLETFISRWYKAESV